MRSVVRARPPKSYLITGGRASGSVRGIAVRVIVEPIGKTP